VKYENMLVCRLPREMRARTCGYWYVVYSDWSISHTAFRTRKSLDLWLSTLGLSLAGTLDNAGDSCRIAGSYRRVYRTPEELKALDGHSIRVMDNAQYTAGVVTVDEDGTRTINLAGPNSNRVVYDYAESEHAMFCDWTEDEGVATSSEAAWIRPGTLPSDNGTASVKPPSLAATRL
jgi:hypothetical protein